jgi:hypothetical protein
MPPTLYCLEYYRVAAYMSFFHLCRAEKYAGWLRNTRGNGQRRLAVVATRGPRQSCPLHDPSSYDRNEKRGLSQTNCEP